MAFLRKMGSVLRQTTSKHSSPGLLSSRPSLFNAIRCMSSSKLFIGGLSYGMDENSLRQAFGKYGEVVEARIIVDRETGNSRGFGFVTYTSSEEASSAIQAMDGQDLNGRRVRVNYASDRPRPNYGGGFGGGGGGYGGGGYGGGGYGGGGNFGNYGGGGSSGFGGGGGGGYGGGNYGDDSFSPANNNQGFNNASNYRGDGGSAGSYGGGFKSSGNFGVAGGGGGRDDFGNDGQSNDELDDFGRDESFGGKDDDDSGDFAKRA